MIAFQYFLCHSILYRSAESSCLNDALTTSTPPSPPAPVVRRSIRTLGDLCACRGGVNGGISSAAGQEARFDDDWRDGAPGRPTRAGRLQIHRTGRAGSRSNPTMSSRVADMTSSSPHTQYARRRRPPLQALLAPCWVRYSIRKSSCICHDTYATWALEVAAGGR